MSTKRVASDRRTAPLRIFISWAPAEDINPRAGAEHVQQIKFFKSVESEIEALERTVNTWLKSSGAKVINIFGNIAPQSPRNEPASSQLLGATRPTGRGLDPSDIFIAVLYEAG